MKGSYASRSMHLIYRAPPGAARLAEIPVGLSAAARQRLRWFDYWASHDHNVALTRRHFGISWRARYNPRHLRSLEARSRRPRRVRQPATSPALRRQYPRWGKDKLVGLLHRQGWSVSAATVGRILARAKRRGLLREPGRSSVVVRRARPPRPYAMRKPKEYLVAAPGDLVQVDTLDVRPFPGVIRRPCSARDLVSRWDVLQVYSQATAATATHFLDALHARRPFPVRALQVDGGAEFRAGFETACQQRGMRLFVLPPRSPKLNGHVERAQRTHTEEFYEGRSQRFGIAWMPTSPWPPSTRPCGTGRTPTTTSVPTRRWATARPTSSWQAAHPPDAHPRKEAGCLACTERVHRLHKPTESVYHRASCGRGLKWPSAARCQDGLAVRGEA